MGQQQLLLLVLGIVIVAVAIAVAINIFVSRTGAIAEQYVSQTINDCIKIGQLAQLWAKKPAELGGGGWSFKDFTLSKIGFPDSTSYAIFKIKNKTKTGFRIVATTVEGQIIKVDVTLHNISNAIVEW
jgi:type II secretory pathway pseudopilin PulG